MNFKKLLLTFVICLFSLGFAVSCEDDPVNNGGINNVDPLKGCTPIFKGTSIALEEKKEDLILYMTDVKDEYFIPYFFNGALGEITFEWNRSTNEIAMKETYTGLLNLGYPVYLVSQCKYNDTMGEKVEKSYYDPATNSFSFSVLLEMMDDAGNVVLIPTLLGFEVTETL